MNAKKYQSGYLDKLVNLIFRHCRLLKSFRLYPERCLNEVDLVSSAVDFMPDLEELAIYVKKFEELEDGEPPLVPVSLQRLQNLKMLTINCSLGWRKIILQRPILFKGNILDTAEVDKLMAVPKAPVPLNNLFFDEGRNALVELLDCLLERAELPPLPLLRCALAIFRCKPNIYCLLSSVDLDERHSLRLPGACPHWFTILRKILGANRDVSYLKYLLALDTAMHEPSASEQDKDYQDDFLHLCSFLPGDSEFQPLLMKHVSTHLPPAVVGEFGLVFRAKNSLEGISRLLQFDENECGGLFRVREHVRASASLVTQLVFARPHVPDFQDRLKFLASLGAPFSLPRVVPDWLPSDEMFMFVASLYPAELRFASWPREEACGLVVRGLHTAARSIAFFLDQFISGEKDGVVQFSSTTSSASRSVFLLLIVFPFQSRISSAGIFLQHCALQTQQRLARSNFCVISVAAQVLSLSMNQARSWRYQSLIA